MKKVAVNRIRYSDKEIKSIGNKDCLIAALWDHCNYGSVISAYALYKFLEKEGKKPAFLNTKPNQDSALKYAPQDFIYKNCDILSADMQKEELNKASMFVAGSDVIWHDFMDADSAQDVFFGMPFENMEKISFASSFGKLEGDVTSQSQIVKLKRSFADFKKISVRNGYDVGVCKDIFDLQASIVLDPVFLCDEAAYKESFANRVCVAKDPYIFSYIENKNERVYRYINEGIRSKNMLCKTYRDIAEYKGSKVEAKSDISVEAWLSDLYHSDYIVTDSYYCTCLAIVFNKPFSVITGSDFKAKEEIEELLGWFELKERMVPCDEYSDMNDYRYLFRKPVNYKRVNDKLENLKQASFNWMQDM